MSRFQSLSEPTIILRTVRSTRTRVGLAPRTDQRPGAPFGSRAPRPRTTFTGIVGAICMYPLRAIINACVALRIHPNTLTLIGVIVNVAAAWALGFGRFTVAGIIMIVANIFDFIDGKVAHR